MAKSAKMSLEQLRSRTWPTRADAVKTLKLNGFPPKGEDYELREHSPGSWQVLALADALQGDEQPSKAIDPASLFEDPEPEKKPGPMAKSQLTDPAVKATQLPERKARGIRTGPVETPPPESTPPEQDKPAAYVDPTGGALCGDVMFILRGVPGKEVEGIAPNAHAITTVMHLLGQLGNPFYQIEVVKVAPVERIALIDWDQRIAFKGSIKETRKAESAERNPERKAGRAPREPGAGPNPASKAGRGIALLSRANGATAAELSAATGWPFGQRHANRLSSIAGRKLKQLGEKKWKLEA